jgi:membrane protein YdbS with pleckstrin-like domain
MGMMDQACSYRVLTAGACWVLAVAVGMIAWLERLPYLRLVVIGLMGIACTLTVIHDNARTRRVVRLSSSEPAERVRSLR